MNSIPNQQKLASAADCFPKALVGRALRIVFCAWVFVSAMILTLKW